MDFADVTRETIRSLCAESPTWAEDKLVELARIIWPEGDPDQDADSGTIGEVVNALHDLRPPRTQPCGHCAGSGCDECNHQGYVFDPEES